MPETLPQPLRTTLALLPVSRGRGCHGSGSPECIEPSRSNRSAGRGAHHAGESLHMPYASFRKLHRLGFRGGWPIGVIFRGESPLRQASSSVGRARRRLYVSGGTSRLPRHVSSPDRPRISKQAGTMGEHKAVMARKWPPDFRGCKTRVWRGRIMCSLSPRKVKAECRSMRSIRLPAPRRRLLWPCK